MYITSRERMVIDRLLHARDSMTVNEIATDIGVSVRTIHRDLKNIESIVFAHNLELEKKAGVGLRIIGNQNDIQQLELTLSQTVPSGFTSEERHAMIIATLLEAKEPMKLFTLATELKVTVATISNDLDQLEENLENFNLHLVRKRGYGVKVEGSEANKRSAISHLIATYVNPLDFTSLLKENIQKKSELQADTISHRLLGLVDSEMLSLIEREVEQARDELPHKLADSAYVGLVVHLALAIKRLQKGETITFDQVFMKQIETTKEYEIAKKMILNLGESLAMDIPDDEIGYITMHLLGAKLRIDHHYLIEESSFDIIYQTKKLINYVSSNMDVDLAENTSLLNDLVAHLKPAIYRLKQKMRIANPMLEEIRKDYPVLFQVLTEGVGQSFPSMEFPDDEIAFIVLHFAAAIMYGEQDLNLRALVVCSSGIGTAKMLATKLGKIPEIKQIENASMFDLQHLSLDEYDIIVSTVPLQNFSRDYSLISPILTQTETERIKEVIRHIQRDIRTKKVTTRTKPEIEKQSGDFIPQLEALHHYTNAILDLLYSFHVWEISEKQSRESLLNVICKSLEKDQFVKNSGRIVKKLLKREQVSGLGIPTTSLALYHTRSDDIVRPSFTICSLNHPLQVPGMDGDMMMMDTLLVMLAPEITNQEVLEVFSYVSSLIIQGQEDMRLFESGDEAKIKQYLSTQFRKFLNEKKLI